MTERQTKRTWITAGVLAPIFLNLILVYLERRGHMPMQPNPELAAMAVFLIAGFVCLAQVWKKPTETATVALLYFPGMFVVLLITGSILDVILGVREMP
jgi:hypothetical protein